MHLRAVTARGFRAGAEHDLTCVFPGRFSLLVGANNAGKTTVCEAIYLAHRHRFPQLPRPSANALRPASQGPRELAIEYAFDPDLAAEGPLGRLLRANAQPPPAFSKPLSRSLGRIRVEGADEGTDGLRLVYLPAYRNPVDELARREADIIVELLRAEQQRRVGHRNLHTLRHRADNLLAQLARDGLIESLEARIQAIMTQLSGGIARQFPFVGGQAVDDQFLARVLELLLAPQLDRNLGQRLELSGLGYVNLLHIAVTIAAIPDLGATPTGTGATDPAEATPDQAREELDETAERAEAEEDSFFRDVFHTTVVIEEPEAHLHPQLQHGLIRHLRTVVDTRPELQVVVSSHASELISAVAPADIVVVRRAATGARSFVLAELPGPAGVVRTTLRMAALHLDVTRSASLFAERLVLVEGISDALVLRQLALRWAGADQIRRHFVDSLTILPIGSKVGEWPVRLLATPEFEMVTRLAVLTDSDNRVDAEPSPPAWTNGYSDEVFIYRMNHPTLEPALALPGNRAVIAHALQDVGLDVPDEVNPATVDALFRRASSIDGQSVPADPGAGKKGDFAYHLASRLADGEPASVPDHITEVLEFIFHGVTPGDDDPVDAEPGGADAVGSADAGIQADNAPGSD